jgi:hypothetical protein
MSPSVLGVSKCSVSGEQTERVIPSSKKQCDMGTRNMWKLIAIGVGIFFLTTPTVAEANWQPGKTPNGTFAAMSMTLPTRDERHAMLIIDFDPRQNCAVHVGVNVYEGAKLGAFVSHGVTDAAMYVQTAGLRWSGGGKTYVKYSNGIEIMMSIGEDFIEAIKKRGDVRAQIGVGQIIEFPGGSNFGAIETARRACWAMR